MLSKNFSKLYCMGNNNRYYIKFNTKDFQTNISVRNCSASAIGVYTFLLCLLNGDDDRYGKYYLDESLLKEFEEILLKQNAEQNNKQIVKQIPSICLKIASHFAKHLPYEKEEICSGLTELLLNDVVYFEGFVLCQKRMIRDAYISKVRAKSGSKGGKNSTHKEKTKNKNFANNLLKQKQQQNPNYNYLLLKEVVDRDREGVIGNEEGVQGAENPGEGKEGAGKISTSEQNQNIAIKFYEVEDMLKIYFDTEKFARARELLAMSKFMDLAKLRLWATAFNTYLISHAIDLNSNGVNVKQDSDWVKHFAFWLAKQDMTLDPKNLDSDRQKKYAEIGKKYSKNPPQKNVSEIDKKIADETDPEKRRELQKQKYAVIR